MNPKALAGNFRYTPHVIPPSVLGTVALKLSEGGFKYGTYNWRDSAISATTYYDATRRHLDAWFEGQDIDPDSGIHHLAGAIASLVVCLDGVQQNFINDDRPIANRDPDWWKKLNEEYEAIKKKFPEPKDPFTQLKRELEYAPKPPVQLTMFDVLEDKGAQYDTYTRRNNCACGEEEC